MSKWPFGEDDDYVIAMLLMPSSPLARLIYSNKCSFIIYIFHYVRNDTYVIRTHEKSAPQVPKPNEPISLLI